MLHLIFRLCWLTRWHEAVVDDQFVWRRYNTTSRSWETKPMTDKEEASAILAWIIR